MRWLLMLFLALTLLACGGGDDTPATDPRATTATTAASPSPTVAPQTPEPSAANPTSEPTATEARIDPTATVVTPTEPAATAETSPTEGAASEDDPELAEMLVRLDELPAGWIVSPDDAEDDSDGSNALTGCTDEDDLSGSFEGRPTASASFQASEFGPFLAQSLFRLANDDDAKRMMDAIRDAFSCETWTDSEGIAWNVAALSFGEHGDDTFAGRITGISGGFPLQMDLVMVRADEYILMTTNVGLGATDPTVAEAAVEAALGRLD